MQRERERERERATLMLLNIETACHLINVLLNIAQMVHVLHNCFLKAYSWLLMECGLYCFCLCVYVNLKHSSSGVSQINVSTRFFEIA